MVMEYELIKKDLEENLTKDRYDHTVRVVDTALKLNQYYELGLDEEKVAYTALLHDCAKDLEKQYFKEYKKKYDLKKKEVFKHKSLAHAYLGAIVAKEKYGVEDEEILEAIRCHTTGKEDMNDLEKLLCLADYIEPGRKFKNAGKVRAIVDRGLDEALLLSFNLTLLHLLKNAAIIKLDTVRARNYLQRRVNDKA